MEAVVRNSPCIRTTEESGERKGKMICHAARGIYKPLQH